MKHTKFGRIDEVLSPWCFDIVFDVENDCSHIPTVSDCIIIGYIHYKIPENKNYTVYDYTSATVLAVYSDNSIRVYAEDDNICSEKVVVLFT